MALDPSIILSGRPLDIGAAARAPFQGAALLNQAQNRPLQNQLLQQQASPEQLAGAGFQDAAGKALTFRTNLDKNKREQFDSGIRTLNAFTEGLTDVNDPRFSAGLQSALDAGIGIDADDIQQAMQLGPQVIQRLAKAGGKVNLNDVQSSKILPGGLTQIVRKGGQSEIVRLSPEDTKLVQEAETRGAELQGLRAGERKEAEKSAKVSAEAFEQVGKIRGNITNLEEVVRLVGEGAETGPLANRLPSFRAASIALDTTRNRLGLDVIGAVTFGALSKGELDLALDTALPTGLEGPQLIEWANRKIVAQRKLSDYFEEQARFLGVPGNKIVDFIEQKRTQTGTAPQREEGAGQVLRFDAQGNPI